MALIRRLLRRPRRGVALLAFGGPESLDEVPPFIASIIGRVPPAHVEHEVLERYREIGGRSPLPETTRLEAALLRSELARRDRDWSVYVGMLHARPTMEEAAARVAGDRIAELVVIPMTPYRATVSSEAYRARFREALRATGARTRLRFPDDWNLHPRYLAALTDVLRRAIERISPDQRPFSVVFSAHSLPISAIEGGDPYRDQLEATAAAVADELDLDDWHMAYQSVSSVASEPWLGPEVEEVLDELKGAGRKAAVVYPIGFLTDHLETLFDNDIEQREHAERIGLAFHRPPCLNDHPLLIEALADIAEAAAGA